MQLCGSREAPPLLLILVVVWSVEISSVREVGAVVGGKVVRIVVVVERLSRGVRRGGSVPPPPRRLGRRTRRAVSLT